ncbi:MAG TPA: hypothetical protein VKF82_04575, partial [Candidatus Eremiobacteraceae bacterium]|nr:hypothetical protein [Candidatus Eremiobacteraceae bacterium]
MKRVHTSFAVAALAVAGMLFATAPTLAQGSDQLVAPQVVADSMGSMNFGSPPSGEIPILYNDHHVYANPSELKQNRTLAALVKNGVILVPLR